MSTPSVSEDPQSSPPDPGRGIAPVFIVVALVVIVAAVLWQIL